MGPKDATGMTQSLGSNLGNWAPVSLYPCQCDNKAWIWLVGCLGLNGPLRQYFSLYRAVSQREGGRKELR